MNTMLFIKTVLLFSLILCFSGCNTVEEKNESPSSPVQCETRGTWLWASSIDSPTKRSFVIEKILKANLNTVFISIPPIAENFGYGNIDNFLPFIIDARSRGLNLHAWMLNGMRKGKNVTVDFKDPVEQEAQAQWVLALLTDYGQYFNGIHLDHIRYPKSEAANKLKRDGIIETISKIRNVISTNFPGKSLTATSFVIRPVNSKNGNPSQWFVDWLEANSGSIYSGNKIPYFMQVQQDPVEWLNKNLIDNFMPMQYTTDDGVWNQEVDAFLSFNRFYNNEPADVFMGIGWIEKSSSESTRGYDAAGIVRKIKYGRSKGMKGFVIFILFNHGYDDASLIDALTIDSTVNSNDAPFKNSVSPCSE